MGIIIAIVVGFVEGAVFGVLLGDDTGYERGCQETHDYYHARGGGAEMNWEFMNDYAWETMGQARTTAFSPWEKLTGSGKPYDEPQGTTQTNKDWSGNNE